MRRVRYQVRALSPPSELPQSHSRDLKPAWRKQSEHGSSRAVALVICFCLSAAAVLCFLWSVQAARVLLLLEIVAVAVVVIAHADRIDGLGAWTIMFGCGALGCGIIAHRHLRDRGERWVHRFVIYASYAATFAAVAAVALWLKGRATSGLFAAAIIASVYIAGSAGVVTAKTLIVRYATAREYALSVAWTEEEGVQKEPL
jgi:hypothetical protein